jgi:hypothetical protein
MTALAAARITVRLHRFEVVAFGLLVTLGVGLAVLVATRLDALGYGPECVLGLRDGIVPAGCEFKVNLFYGQVQREAGPVSAILGFVPYLAALLLGVAVVGREVDRGTTRLAWALAPSRTRWYLQRLVPVLLVVGAIGLAAGLAADRLLASTEPGVDPANAFLQFGSRGAVLGARVVFVFATGVLVGSLLGRVLPAVIVGGLVAIVGLVGGSWVHERWIRSEAVVLPEAGPNDLYVDQRFRLPDGRLVGWDEVEQHDPPPTDPNFEGVWPTLPEVAIAVPGTRYVEVQLREIAALAGGSLLALVAAALVVQRRRPG